MDLSGSLQGAGGVGGLLATIHDTNAYTATYDANGNISEYLDTAGVIVAHREYSPFGETVVATGDKVADFAHWFSTKYMDSETGLYYYGYRFYSPEVGRWINRDPIGEWGGMNLYGFCNNSPVINVDVHGDFIWTSVLMAFIPRDINISFNPPGGSAITIGGPWFAISFYGPSLQSEHSIIQESARIHEKRHRSQFPIYSGTWGECAAYSDQLAFLNNRLKQIQRELRPIFQNSCLTTEDSQKRVALEWERERIQNFIEEPILLKMREHGCL
ncbi:MAG: RHS repeat-associated core domain-containing protein [Lentisphaerae bacterium]|nr:RHS repeat-associated core domain-containing protein [Lentisphaerota bacterium]